MAVVDAAVGIKTAVNFHEKKNKLGTYQPPLGVLYDTAFLHTLEARHISNGSAEVLKMACIKDQNLFELLETYGQDMIDQKFQVCTSLCFWQADHQVCGSHGLGSFFSLIEELYVQHALPFCCRAIRAHTYVMEGQMHVVHVCQRACTEFQR
jgi:hypothetical protein